MTIKLNLVLSLILEAVKAETHIKGQIDRAIDEKAAKVAYQEEAGDEQFHERKLMRGIYTSLDALKTEIAPYLASYGGTQGDNMVSVVNEATDSITITLEVSNSFNTSFTDSLARLCSKYIEDSTLVLWWGTFNGTQAQYYTALQAADSLAIAKCFVKKAPQAVPVAYTENLSVLGSGIEVEVGEETTITYSIDENAIDDIEIDPRCNFIHWRRVKGGFAIKATCTGFTCARLYSLHNDDVECEVDILVTGSSNMPDNNHRHPLHHHHHHHH